MLDPTQWAAALAIALFAGAASGITSFGAGMMLSAYLVPILGAKVTVPALAVAMLLTNLSRIWAFRGAVSFRPALQVMAGLVPTAVIGSLIFVRMSSTVADLVVGLFLVLSIPLRRWISGRQAAVPPAGMAAGGALIGVISGMTTGAGSLLVPLFLGAGLTGAGLIATDAVVAVAMHITRSLTYGRFALLDSELLLLGLTLGLATVPGSYIAAWIVRRTSLKVHTLVIEALVVLAGGIAAGRALWSMLAP
ncbi:MAG: sulfite exporter TauE/SafE family protein [Hyphomicrobiaceae bacterium]|nr:sulfite exporter TauE/SafE family protein [Hyphomicrobiaceae bacterium]